MNNAQRTLFILLAASLIFGGGFSCRLGGGETDGGMFKSTDRGESWEQKVFVKHVKKKNILIDRLDVRMLLMSPQDPSTIYLASTTDGVYKTTDGGEQWFKTGLSTGNVTSLAIHPTSPTTLYATIGRNLYRSQDSADHWTQIYTSSKSDNSLYNVVIDVFDPKKIYATDNVGSVVKSLDEGVTWQVSHRFSKPVDLIRLDPQDTRRIFAVIDGGGLEFSSDGGQSWVSLDDSLKPFKDGTHIQAFVFAPQSSQVIYLGANHSLLRSLNGGQSWENVPTLLEPSASPIRTVAVDPQNSQRLYLTVQNILYRSDDNGVNWKPLRSLSSQRVISQLLIHPTQSDILYTGVITLK